MDGLAQLKREHTFTNTCRGWARATWAENKVCAHIYDWWKRAVDIQLTDRKLKATILLWINLLVILKINEVNNMNK